jgi:2-polyprenyl-3-methyl-5-hydroxy-6-metoxy-1,4-benzoquinol methylase
VPNKFNPKKTEDYFDSLADTFYQASAPRDDIFLERILPLYTVPSDHIITALDFGCGGGALLLKMLNKGVDAKGVEKHSKLCSLAKDRLEQSGFDPSCVMQGSISELGNFKKHSFDFVVLMGVFQYVPLNERLLLMRHIYDLLKPGGHMVATFQNALFDLFTFNKYSIDFMQQKIFQPLGVDSLLGESILTDLRALLTHPDKPDFSPLIARDNIFVETTNPLTISEELKVHGFMLMNKYFYNFFFVPRLIEKDYADKLSLLKKEFEVTRSTEWFGHLLANAFVVDCIKEE